jgi:hypothetical protein
MCVSPISTVFEEKFSSLNIKVMLEKDAERHVIYTWGLLLLFAVN